MKKLPEISRVSEIEFNSVIQIFGENFENAENVYLWYPKSGTVEYNENTELPETPPENAIVLKINKVFERVIYVSPSDLTNDTAAVLWVKNSDGFSKPTAVNCPRIFSISHTKITKGSLLSVYGQLINKQRKKVLCFKNKTTGESVYVKNACDLNYLFDREKYVAEFFVPENIESGKYTVKINNGTNGEFGWSNEFDVTVTDEFETISEYCRERWNQCANKNRKIPKAERVVISAPAEGAFIDMTEEIQSAINSLENGGTVVLKTGVYGISRTIELKEGVVLKGAGNKNTIIRTVEGGCLTQDWSDVVFAERKAGMKRWAGDWKPHYLKYNPASLVRIHCESGIENIGLEMGDGANIGVLLASKDEEPVYGAFLNNISVDALYQNVFEDERGYGASCIGLLSVSHSDCLTVYNSKFSAVRPIDLLPAHNKHTRLIHNTFECSPAQIGESYISGAYYGIFVGNNFLNGRRSFMSQDGFYYNFVAQNRSSGVARSENALETYMSEFGRGIWHGYCTAADSNSITIAENLDDYSAPQTYADVLDEYEQVVCIIDGRGFGQYRNITDYKNGKIYINEPWAVLPDNTTYFAVMQATLKNIYLNNNTDLSNGGSPFFYGAGIDNHVEGQDNSLSGGLAMTSLSIFNSEENNKIKYEIKVGAFNVISGCQTRACGAGVGIGMDVFMATPEGDDLENADDGIKHLVKTMGVFGNIIKKNAFDGSEGLFYIKNLTDWQAPWVPGDPADRGVGVSVQGGYNIIERNVLRGFKNAVKIGKECEGNYIGGNTYTKGLGKIIGHKEKAFGPDVE